MVLLFAPMATLSHAGFRHWIEDWGGCDLYFSEMIDSFSFLQRRPYEKYYQDARPCPEKVIFQIVGSDEDALVETARQLALLPCRGIDINMGCSAPHIFQHGAGIAWMADADRAARLTARLRQAVGSKSLSMKLRLGETEDEAPLVRLAQALQNAGADFLTLHPRIRKDSLSRPARWEWVPQLRAQLKIPVMGNGDISSLRQLQDRLARPADGYMIGRRAVSAPWTFRYWVGRLQDPEFDFSVALDTGLERFHELLERYQPREFWVSRSRRFYTWYARNLQFGHRWAARLQLCRDYEELRQQAALYWQENPQERQKTASSLDA